ncbi:MULTISPECIES: hypothetical protein [Streptosporangium]|uniref:Protein kinase domain-containing protein n=1 Tax=Streptosporangium brasiliense TaxID=47480 RepID=A0ABT9R027_9ACTN|nr:hypothetical protein [Streptosporangium brasiliense]MDP9862587.1 hypothetical protein [Streptosporangium brasiliense]
MNHPDVPRSQGRHASAPAAGPAPAGAPSPAVLEQASLEQVIGRLGPMTPQQAATVGLAVLDQLVAVHTRGLLHGDVRPGSVLLGPHDQIILSAPTFRSPTFTAPEGVTGPAADLWSLGATLYTAVEGRQPSPGGSLDSAGPLASILFQLLSGDPAQRPEPGTLRNILLGVSQNRGEAPAPLPPAPGGTPAAPVDPPVPADLLGPSPVSAGAPSPSGPPASAGAPFPVDVLAAPADLLGPSPDSAGAPSPPDALSPSAILPGPPDVLSPSGTLSNPPDAPSGPADARPGASAPAEPPPFDSADTMPPRPASDPSAIPPVPPVPDPRQAPPGAPASRELVPASAGPRDALAAAPASGEPTDPAGRSRQRAGVLVPRPIVALTGVLVVGMAATIGFLLVSPPGGSGGDGPTAEPVAAGKGLFAAAPRACSLLDDQQADEVVPGFRSSEVEPAACDWLNQHDWRKPGPEKFDLRVRLVAQKADASGVQRAKEYLAGKRTDSVERGKFATPKPAPPQTLKGIGEEAFSTAGYSSINLYGGSYKVTVVFRTGNLIAQVDYERGGVKDDRDGKIAEGAQKVARWLTQSLKTDG